MVHLIDRDEIRILRNSVGVHIDVIDKEIGVKIKRFGAHIIGVDFEFDGVLVVVIGVGRGCRGVIDEDRIIGGFRQKGGQ